MEEYKTVCKAAEAEYEEKRSRFIGSIIPCKTEEEALRFLAKRRSETFGARHNVYAYILRENNICRYSDDGEPHFTAGVPTLDVLKKQGLCDCCIVTTRYFGGVLLGTGGLVRAYTSAATAAINVAGIAVMRECYMCKVICQYSDHSQVERLLEDLGAKIDGCDFTHEVTVLFSVKANDYEKIKEKFTDTFNGRLSPEVFDSGFAEV